jgi:flagellar motor switch protein FliN/FliY
MSEQITDSQSTGKHDDVIAAASAEQGNPESSAETAQAVNASGQGDTGYERAEFQDLAPEPGSLRSVESNLDVILDIPVTLSMEVGRTEVPIHDLLQLNRGSVVELDRIAGEPMDVMINGTLIAHGEVVVVNEKFGIRLTDVISPAERVRKLR